MLKYLIKFKNWIIFSVLGVGIVLAAGHIIPKPVDLNAELMTNKYLQAVQIKEKYDLQNTILITKIDHIDDTKIEIGEIDNFKPNMRISKWDDEVSLKIKPKLNLQTNKKELHFENNKIKYKEDKKEYHLYEIEDGYEYEIILLEKPKSNIVELEIETTGLAFYYQPELTQEEIDEGCVRPENIIGSYAVYHESKQGDYSKMGKKNYRAGKAFHIYRPKIIDNAGTEIWGELNITDNLLTVEIPQEFLDNAIYPVIVDPTFGWGSIGETGTVLIRTTLRGLKATGTIGTGVSISAALENTYTSPRDWVAGLYDTNYNLITNGGTAEGNVPADEYGHTWRTNNFLSSPTLSAIDYYIVVHGEAAGNYSWGVAYDSISGYITLKKPNITYTGSAVSSISTPTIYTNQYRYSIYCTYTSGGNGEEVEVSKPSVIWFD